MKREKVKWNDSSMAMLSDEFRTVSLWANVRGLWEVGRLGTAIEGIAKPHTLAAAKRAAEKAAREYLKGKR